MSPLNASLISAARTVKTCATVPLAWAESLAKNFKILGVVRGVEEHAQMSAASLFLALQFCALVLFQLGEQRVAKSSSRYQWQLK